MKKKELLIKILQRLKESDFDVEFEAENICTLFRDDDEIKPKKLMVMGFIIMEQSFHQLFMLKKNQSTPKRKKEEFK